MVKSLTYSASIFESLGVLSSFNFAEAIWESYEKFAVSKIKDSTMKLRGAIFYLKDYAPKDAAREYNSIAALMPVLTELRNLIESLDELKFRNFKMTAIEFLDVMDLLFFNLRDIAEVHSSYKLSHPVLAKDWNSPEDAHWDNY